MAWNDPDELEERFRFVCPARWDEMSPTDQRGVRTCPGCAKEVFAVDSSEAFEKHARAGHCVFALVATGERGYIARPDGGDGPRRDNDQTYPEPPIVPDDSLPIHDLRMGGPPLYPPDFDEPETKPIAPLRLILVVSALASLLAALWWWQGH